MEPITSIHQLIKRYFEIDDGSLDIDVYYKFRYFAILLINPKNLSPAGRVIIDNLEYLNLRTRNVKFFIPGIASLKYPSSIETKNFLKFDYRGFYNSVSVLEEYLEGFSYNEGANLIILDMKISSFCQSLKHKLLIKKNEFFACDLDHYINNNVNIINVINTLTKKIETDDCDLDELYFYLNKLESKNNRGINIFIAGSKNLIKQRNAVKSELLSIQNDLDYRINVYFYGDFKDSFIYRGRQIEYNSFIKNYTEYIIFILDGDIGGITFMEFQVAMSSYLEKGSPLLFVYLRMSHTLASEDRWIKQIKEFCHNRGQYYVEYENEVELPYLVYKSFNKELRTRSGGGKRYKTSNEMFIIQSINSKMDFEDIARIKNLDFNELLTEIEDIVNSGTKLDISYYFNNYMDDDTVEDIYLYFKENADSDSLDAAIKELGSYYTEREIRLVRIKFLCEMDN